MKKLTRKTKRLTIRPLVESDYAAWKQAYSILSSARNKWDHQGRSPEELTRAAFWEALKFRKKARDQDQFYDLGVFENATGHLIGSVAVMDVQRGLSHSAYLGYSIFNPYWGRGFGKEAVLAMIDIAFADLKLHRVEAGIEPSNRRSIFLARSIGLRKEGLKKRAVYLRGAWVDLVMYSATCEEFGFKWTGAPLPRKR